MQQHTLSLTERKQVSGLAACSNCLCTLLDSRTAHSSCLSEECPTDVQLRVFVFAPATTEGFEYLQNLSLTQAKRQEMECQVSPSTVRRCSQGLCCT